MCYTYIYGAIILGEILVGIQDHQDKISCTEM